MADDVVDDAFDERPLLERISSPELRQAIIRAWARALARSIRTSSDEVGEDVAYDPEAPGLRALFREVATRIKTITDETMARVRGYVETAREEGLSPQGLAKLIRNDESDAFGAARARTIARTESAVAYNRGSVYGWRATGRVKEVECLDSPECGLDGHDDAEKPNGQRYPIDTADEFPVSHPNCVRVWIPVLDLDAPADDGAEE